MHDRLSKEAYYPEKCNNRTVEDADVVCNSACIWGHYNNTNQDYLTLKNLKQKIEVRLLTSTVVILKTWLFMNCCKNVNKNN